MCDPPITRLHGSVTSVVRATRQVNGRRQTYPSHHIIIINVQNFHGSLTTVVRVRMTPLKQQISLILFSIEHWCPYKRQCFENR